MDEKRFQKLKAQFLALPVVQTPDAIESLAYLVLRTTDTEKEFVDKLFPFFWKTASVMQAFRTGDHPLETSEVDFSEATPGRCSSCGIASESSPLFKGGVWSSFYCAHCALFALALAPVNGRTAPETREAWDASVRMVCSADGDCLLCAEFLEHCQDGRKGGGCD